MEEIVVDMFPGRPFLPWQFRFSAHPRGDGGADWVCRIGLDFRMFGSLHDLLAAEGYCLDLQGPGLGSVSLPCRVVRTETFEEHVEAELAGTTDRPLRGVFDSRAFEGWGPFRAAIYRSGGSTPSEVPQE